MEAWQNIISKVLALDYETDEDGKKQNFHLIDMEEEARDEFIVSHNATIQRTNAIEDDSIIESPPMKAPVHVTRIALILQVMRYACGESHLQFVTKQAMHGAIRLMEYFEDSYCRIREYVANDACDEPSRELLSMLNDSFTTAEALAVGKQLRVTDRTVMNYQKELAKNRLIKKIRQGEYQKMVFETQQMTTSEESRSVNCNE